MPVPILVKNGLPIEFKNYTVEVKLRKSEKGRMLRTENLSLSTQKDEGRHLIKRALNEYKQFPKEDPGVIIVNPTWLIGPQEVEGMTERLNGLFSPNLHTRVSGIIIVDKRAERSGIIKPVPKAVVNPYAKQRCDREIERLTNALFRYPDWDVTLAF